jgi:hypothetical protein
MCKAFPSIDWTKCTWKVKQPAALWSEIRYAPWGYPGSPLIAIFDSNGDPGNGNTFFASYVGDIPKYNGEPGPDDVILAEVYSNTYGYHMRSGEFVSRYRGECQWFVDCRERLCPGVYALFAMQKPDRFWMVSWLHVLNAIYEWTAYRVTVGPDIDPILGPFVFDYPTPYDVSTQNLDYINWRHLMQAAECNFIPTQQARGYEVTGGGGTIEGGLIARLNDARARLQNPAGQSWYYRPTALDLAVEWTLSGGLTFGVESNPDSEFYGQFVVYTGALYETIEVITIEVNNTNLQGYTVGFTVRVGAAIAGGYLLTESFFPEPGETEIEFATRIANYFNAFPFDGYFPFVKLTVTVEQVGSVVTITTRTPDTAKGGYPFGVAVFNPETNALLNVFSIEQRSSQALLQASPWQLVNRPAVVAEFGVVNRFERTDDNDTLPAWIELELIPL